MASAEDKAAATTKAAVLANETPFITDPVEVAALGIPAEFVHRIEEMQRNYSTHYLQFNTWRREYRMNCTTVGVQCFWLGVGAWVTHRGLRYSDPITSVFARWVTHNTARRLTTPISCLGITIFTVTSWQMVYDVKALCAARMAMQGAEQRMIEAQREREKAYAEGSAAQLAARAKEQHDFVNNLPK